MAQTRFSEQQLSMARDRFYPEWWLHEAQSRMSDVPRYLVICRSEEDEALALAAKPDFLDVRLTLDP